MTSLSRKKRQTTPPNTVLAKATDQFEEAVCGTNFDQTVPALLRPSRRETTWLPAALLATLMMLSSALQAFGEEASQLGWRPARTAQRNQVRTAQRHQVRRTDAHNQKQTTRTEANRVRLTGETHDQGYSVVQVSYDELPEPKQQGVVRLQSVVVHPRDPRFAGTGPVLRVTQNTDPFGDEIDQDDELNRDILQGFNGDQPGTDTDLESSVLPKPDGSDEGLEITPPDGFDMPDEGLDVQDDTEDSPQIPFFEPTTQPPLEPRIEKLPPAARTEMEKELSKAAERHEQALSDTRADVLSRIDLSLSVDGQEGLNYPWEGSIDTGELYAGRHWPEVTYMWKAAANCHKPLYFEQPQLERYGHSWGPFAQPIVSGAHFFSRIPVLPYCMGIKTPNECVYPLGHYRPGNCAPYVIPAVPFTWRAALFQGGAVTGTAFVLP